MDFVPKRWQKYVYDEDGSINRKYYELAAMTELKNHIRSGDVWVVGSRLHKDFDEYLVPKEEWNKARIGGNRLAVSVSAQDYIKERTEALHKRLKWITNNLDSLDGINLEKSKIQVERLEKSTPEEARSFSLSL